MADGALCSKSNASLHLLPRAVAYVVSARRERLCMGVHQMCVWLYSACVQVPYPCMGALYYRCVRTSAETTTTCAYLPARERERSRVRPTPSADALDLFEVSSGVGLRTVRKSPRVAEAASRDPRLARSRCIMGSTWLW